MLCECTLPSIDNHAALHLTQTTFQYTSHVQIISAAHTGAISRREFMGSSLKS